ncbi:MAG: S41 family peptidase, partial [Candidatus Cybelea sp.]
MHVVRLLGPFALLAALLTAPHPAAAASLSPAAASAWQRDLDYMVKCIEKYHPDAFHSISRAAFEQRVSLLRARIPNFDRAQAVLGLASIIALVHDAHTGFGLGTSPPVSFHALPIKVYQYSDGVFIQSAAPEYRSLVGAEILSVGGVPIATVLQRLLTVVMVTNDWTFRSQLAFQFKGEILHALGLSERDDAATLRVRGPAGVSTVEIKTIPHPFSVGYKPGPPDGSDWVDARSGTAPLYLRHLTKFYWHEWLPAPRTLYVQCNFILNAPDESFTEFFRKVFAFADTTNVDKFVLDLRFNGGGDNTLLPVVVQNLVKRDRLNASGKLFVIIGRGTQSAAENLVNRLQRDTKATFVGEPTGERTNEFGDPWPFILPNSRIEVHVASIQWEDIDPRDDRDWTGPDLAAELTSSDYASNVDPAMNAVQGAPFVPLEDALQPFLDSSVGELHDAYLRYYDDPAHKFTQSQGGVDRIASQLIAAKRYAAAQAFLEWNVRRSPDSARALDALCDAYLSGRDLQKAKACYEGVLASFAHDAIAA